MAHSLIVYILVQLPFSNIFFESFNVIYIFHVINMSPQTFAAMYLRELIQKCSEFTFGLVKSQSG